MAAFTINQPSTLIRVFEGIELEWRWNSELNHYQAYRNNEPWYADMIATVPVYGTYEWLMQLEQPTANNNTVGYAVDGFCYCLDCVEQVTDENDEKRPIIFGHPDWSYGSVPICDSCHREITTIDE